MELDPRTMRQESTYKLLIGCVVPRPIAWVSTVGPDGVNNLAPFSFFMGVCPEPRTARTPCGTPSTPATSWSTWWTTTSPSR